MHMPRYLFSFLLLCWSSLYSTTSLAHSSLAITIPEHQAILNSPPKQLRFLFKAEVIITNIRIDILDPEKAEGQNIIGRIDPQLPGNSIDQSSAYGVRLDLDIPLLEVGSYRVIWQARSRDGRYIVDDFDFKVSPK